MGQNEKCQLAGIDFGASNLKAAKLAGPRTRILKLNKDDMGGNELPNFIYYNKNRDGGIERWLGKRAREKIALVDSENGIGGLKRKLELESWEKHIPNIERSVTSVEALSHTLEILKGAILKGQSADLMAVLTTPVCYTSQQIGRLAKGAEMAGLDVRGFVSESFAAMFALNDLEDYEDGLTVIFDLGGSTLDVSIVRVSREDGRLHIEELVTGGLPLGGLDLDRRIYEEILLPKYAAELQKHWPEEGDTTRQRIMLEAAKHKEMIYLDDVDSVLMMIEPDIELCRADVEEIVLSPAFGGRISALLDSLFEKLEENLNDYGLGDVRHVIALGGCMRIPSLVRLLEDYFGKDVFDSENFDFEDTGEFVDGLQSRYEVVAAGAARYLDILLNKADSISISRVAPFEYGYLEQGNFESCIASNMPCSFQGGLHLLPFAEIEQATWRLPVYQSYPDADNPEAVFLAEVQLNSKLYAPLPVLFRMRTERDGDILIEFFQEGGEDSDEALRLVEKHTVKIGRG